MAADTWARLDPVRDGSLHPHGAPGSGKSTILDALGGDIRVMGEPAREVLAEQRAIDGDGTHDRDRSLFVALLLQRSIDKYDDGATRGETRDCSTAASRTASRTRR